MRISTLQQLLHELREPKFGTSPAHADLIERYVTTRDPACVAELPDGKSVVFALGSIPDVIRLDADFGGVLADFIAEMVKASRMPFVLSPYASDRRIVGPGKGGGNLMASDDLAYNVIASLFHRDPTSGSGHGEEVLLEAFGRVEVPIFQYSKFCLCAAGKRMAFGWKEIPIPEEFRELSAWIEVFEKPPSSVAGFTSIERAVWSLSDAELVEIVRHFRNGGNYERLLGALAALRPGPLLEVIEEAVGKPEAFRSAAWKHVLATGDRFDDLALQIAEADGGPCKSTMQFLLATYRPARFGDAARMIALGSLEDESVHIVSSLSFLARQYPKDFFILFASLIRAPQKCGEVIFEYLKHCIGLSAIQWDKGGADVFHALLEAPFKEITREYATTAHTLFSLALEALQKRGDIPEEWLQPWIAKSLERLEGLTFDPTKRTKIDPTFNRLALQRFWEVLVEQPPVFMKDGLKRLAGSKLKSLRDLAVKGLVTLGGDDLVPFGGRQLTEGKLDERLGGAALLEALADSSGVPMLRQALDAEANDKVRAAIRDAMKPFERIYEVPVDAGIKAVDLEDLLAENKKSAKLPKTAWLEISKLPPLAALSGEALPGNAIVLLIAKQSRHKTLDAAPDILPLLAHIDREKSAPFALALVEGFLNSEQAASDRWALALGGLLGDKRIIPPLLSRIPDWCENSRHKLAEYAAQAIALLPGNEPLMVLDSLSNRYRSKFKNVGKACAEAFNAAAAARGITADELGDMVVPDFGFDGDGIRRFEWDGGGASAELGADFKLSWFDPDTDKAWKSLPANAPAAVKDEVKTLGKLLREAVKAQTARLEMTLVRQRRWPVARWRELFDNHPLLRSFASSLVWGIYDASGTLLRTFRRYPNGLLANAAGELEELSEADTMVGMVHPLELDAAALDAWRAHLGRFKVKQPFPQIDRPVELMDPLHGNRREIALTKGGKVSAGTFRSRSEKRGWTRGSVIDGGGISSYYKLYPGAGVEVVLPTNNFYIGIDPMETVELGAAYFAKAGSVERGSYTYDEPAPDDPRVLRFDQVPAVVWSETMSDLKAILGT